MDKEALKRYDRHIKLDQVGLEGQKKLNEADVLVVGAGGLGCPVLQYLVAAGVGYIGIIDGDKVTLSNLQRQILFKTEDIGQSKAIVAKKRLEKLNNLIEIKAYDTTLTNANALEIMEDYDIVVDCTDNFTSRYMINDACVLLDKILVYGAIHTFEGQVSVFNYQNGPNYRSLFPTPPLPGSTPNCSEVGVIGVLPGIIGTYQASEVIKCILGIGQPLSGTLLIINILTHQQYNLKITKSDKIYSYPNTKFAFKNMDYPLFCGFPDDNTNDEINFQNILPHLEDPQVLLIDVREEYEMPKFEKGQILYLPLSRLAQEYEKVPLDKKVFIFCHLGIRSLNAVKFLKTKKEYPHLQSIKGGIEAMMA